MLINNEKELIKEVNCHSQIIIYGAGMIARLLYSRLASAGLKNKIYCFAVSNKKGNPDSIKHIPVYEIKSINQQIKNSIIIVATLENAHQGIKAFLNSQGIEKMYFVSESLYRDMRNKEVSPARRKASDKLRISEMFSYLDKSDLNIVGFDEENEYLCKMFAPGMKYKAVSAEDFINEKNDDIRACTVFCPEIPLGVELKQFFNRIFDSADKLVISYRRNYINLPSFNLFEEAHKRGFLLIGAKTFFRDKSEYNADDFILCFKKAEPNDLAKDILCTGCGACSKLCPTGALNMKPDVFGYFKPVLDESKCISCGKCLSLCPVKNSKTNKNSSKPDCFAFMAPDGIRLKSSSGGVFTILAEWFIMNHGIVCGAAWNSDFGVEHILIKNAKDIHKLRRSKYMQSDLKNIYKDVQSKLEEGIKVLFTGCPCQVAGLYAYLGKDYDGLYTIDLLCAQEPSQYFFKKYFNENFKMNDVCKYDFRVKDKGWRHDAFKVTLNTGKTIYKNYEDPYQKAYHSRLMMPVHCEYCHFSTYPRQGDLTIGDFWGIGEHDYTLDDKKGTSAVLVNSTKGNELLKILKKEALTCRKVPLEWLNNNRVKNNFPAHFGRDRFYSLIKSSTFNHAVELALNDKYDIGYVGNWSYPNYGSELTNFALYSVLKKWGYSILMIEWPENSEWKPFGSTQLFQQEPYSNFEIARNFPVKGDMLELNNKCDIFVHGSDQLLHNYFFKVFGKTLAFDWVCSNKKKIGYALSFGHDDFFGTDLEQAEMAYYLKKFDAISVRESSGVRIMKEKFGINAYHVLDPVFLCDLKEYDNLIKKGKASIPNNPYLFSYMLDPTPLKGKILKESAKILGLDLRVISDGIYEKDTVTELWDIDTLSEASVESWLAHFANSDFCITDSFHGMCFSIIFKKNFIVIVNEIRGATRFESLLSLLNLENRMVRDAGDILNHEELFEPINYDEVYKLLNHEKEKSITWLKNALSEPKKGSELTDFDILNERCSKLEKMLYELIWQINGKSDI